MDNRLCCETVHVRPQLLRPQLLFCVVFLMALGCGNDDPAPPAAPEDVHTTADVHGATDTAPDALVTPDGVGVGFDVDEPAELEQPDSSGPCVGEGCLGFACLADDECQLGACIWHVGTKVCSGPCETEADCTKEMVCQAGVCASTAPMVCRPCVEDKDCDDAPCLDYGAEGRFCGASCGPDSECPSGYFCSEGQCRVDGVCGCSLASIALGDATVCALSNAWGTCLGQRECLETGLSPCPAVAPAEDVCDGVDNDCDGSTDSVPCDDGNSCTQDNCTETGCAYSALSGAPCLDGNPCTLDEGKCGFGGGCEAEPVDCDDGDSCTADTCVVGVGCVSVDNELCACAVDADCPPPEDRCLGDVVCISTLDKPWLHCVQDLDSAVVCDLAPELNTACNTTFCVPATGLCAVEAQAEGEVCAAAGLQCLDPSLCAAGICVPGLAKDCDDKDACTQDLCTEVTGCINPPLSAGACDDADVCTSDLGCDSVLGCQYADVSADCDDNEECTLDSCDAALGCLHAPKEGAVNCCEAGVSDAGYCLDPLVVDAGPDVAIQLGETASLLAVATGGDGDYGWIWVKAGQSVGATAAVDVSPTQTSTYLIIVSDGAGNVSTDLVTVQVLGVPLTLCDWEVIKFDPQGQTQPLASWSFDEACTTSTQTLNAKPSVLLSPIDFQEGTLTGAFHVDTTDDDDLIGFVFGWQSQSDFYLMDWKQGGQDFCTADVFEGVSIKKVSAPNAPLVCVDFFESLGTEHTATLVKAVPPGWKDFVTYQWTLKITGTQGLVTIADGDTLIHEISFTADSFKGGQFGFYNNSQDSVVYELFQFVE